MLHISFQSGIIGVYVAPSQATQAQASAKHISSECRPFGLLISVVAVGISGGKGRDISMRIPRKSWLPCFFT